MAESSSGAVGGNTLTYSQFKKSRQSLKGKSVRMKFWDVKTYFFYKVQQEQDAKKEEFVQHGKFKSQLHQESYIAILGLIS